MSWKFLLAFGIAIAIYVVVVLVIAFIKKHRAKKKIEEQSKAD